MATLETRLRDLGTAIGTAVKATRTLVNGNAADLSALTTAAKSNLVAAVNEVRALANGKADALGFTPENVANKGQANGYAGLDSGGKVPAAQLPGFVDDVLEYATLAGFPATGATGVMYVDLATNKTYRWSGSAYVEISASPGSTDAVPEGAVNKYFTDARAIAALNTPLGAYDSDYAAVFTAALA
jgi:hypothetical protein